MSESKSLYIFRIILIIFAIFLLSLITFTYVSRFCYLIGCRIRFKRNNIKSRINSAYSIFKKKMNNINEINNKNLSCIVPIDDSFENNLSNVSIV